MRMTQRQFDDAVDGLCRAGLAGEDLAGDDKAARDRQARVYAMALAAIRHLRGIPDNSGWWPDSSEAQSMIQDFFAATTRRQRRILKKCAERAW